MDLAFSLLTTPEAAAQIHMSTRWLAHQIRTGNGPAITSFGRKHFIRSDVWAAWIDAHTANTAAEAISFATVEQAEAAADLFIADAAMSDCRNLVAA